MASAEREALAEHLGIAPLTARSVALSALLGSHPPRLPARALVSMGSMFGVAEGAMRTALSRMTLAGEVVLSGAEYVLGERLRRRQEWQDAARGVGAQEWDGAWWSAMVSAERRSTAQRRGFRALMAEHRMAELRPEIWLRPANIDGPAPADGVLVMRGPITGSIRDTGSPETGSIRDTGSLSTGLLSTGSPETDRDLAGRLWDLPRLAADARELIALSADALAGLRRDADSAMAEAFLVSIAVVRFLRVEPLLPSELVGPGWPPDELRRTYDDLERAYALQMSSFLISAS